ncbi:MAG TPA: hypothetical protein VFC44_25840 [Candidatus Saccharimonadales bacterium]|nr:hypothetical protein [Candidatus Saccharimonadales bacterium]
MKPLTSGLAGLRGGTLYPPQDAATQSGADRPGCAPARPAWLELQKAIEHFLQAWNEAPRPFVWTATVANIMAKVERARQKLDDIKPGWSRRKKRKKRKTRKYV